METLYKSDIKQSPVMVNIYSEEGVCDLSLTVVFTKVFMEQDRAVAIRGAVKDLRALADECHRAGDAIERSVRK